MAAELVTLEVKTKEGGTTDWGLGFFQVRSHTSLSIYAIPDKGWYFSHWVYGALTATEGIRRDEQSLTFMITEDSAIVAYFTTEAPPPALNWWEEIFRKVNPVTMWKDVVERAFPAERTIAAKTLPAKLVDFSKLEAIAEDVRKEADETMEGLGVSQIAIEGLTAGLVDVSVDRLARLAGFRYVDSVGFDVRRMKWETGFRVLYERHLNKQYKARLMPAGAWSVAFQKEWIKEKHYYDMMEQFGFNHESAQLQYALSERPPPLDVILELDRRGLITKPFEREIYKSTLVQGWAVDWIRQLKVQYPEPYRIAEMASKGLIDKKERDKVFSIFGMSEHWSKMWTEAQWMHPTVGMLNSMLWRKAIDQKEWSLHLRRSQFTDAAIKQLKSLQAVIPPLPDLIVMAVKEAFGEHTYEEQMPALIDWGSRMGLSKDWVERYWYAHWSRIALREMYSNLWRGHWTKEQFMRMLRIKDVHPDDREAIYRVAFIAPSIRELGYGYDMNVYQRPDIVKYRKMGGLSPDDAEKSADSLIQYRTSAELEAIRREYLWQYSREKITEEQFRVGLLETDMRMSVVDLWVQRGNLQIERFKIGTITEEGRVIAASEALWAFKNKLRDENWLKAALMDLDWTAKRILLAVEKAKTQMIETPEPEPDVTYKRLTLSQLQQLYRRGLLGLDAFRDKLIELTFTPLDADLIIELTEPMPEVIPEAKGLTRSDIRNFYELRRLSKEQIVTEFEKIGYMTQDAETLALDTMLSVDLPVLKARYRNRWIDDEGLIRELWLIGVDAGTAIEIGETVIANEMPERTAAERDLSASEIIRGVKVGILEAEEAVDLLEKMGYDRLEAWFKLLVVKTIDEPEKQSYWVWRQIVEAWRKSSGLSYVDIPDDVIMLDLRLVAIKNEVKKEREGERRITVLGDLAVRQAKAETDLRGVLRVHHIS